MWPNAKICVMGGDQAANVLSTVRDDLDNESEKIKFKTKIKEQYEKESSAYYSTSRLWDDGIIDPRDTRFILGMALGACLNNYDKVKIPNYNVFRM